MQAPFDRTNLGIRERPLSRDFNRENSQIDLTLRDLMQAVLSGRSLTSRAAVPYSGFIGDGLRVAPTSPIGLSVQVLPGFGFQYNPADVPTDIGAPDFLSVDDRSAYKPISLLAPAVFNVPTAPSAGLSRIDIIEVRADRRLDDPETRRQLGVGTNTFSDHVFFKTLAWGIDGRTGLVNSPSASTAALSYKRGAEAATGTEIEPSVTAGYVQIGRINVGPTVTTIDRDVLVDRRPLLFHGGHADFGGSWRVQWNGGSPIITTLSTNAPPGIAVGLAPLVLRGAGNFYALGGQILNGSVTMTVRHVNGTSLTNSFGVGIQRYAPGTPTGDQIITIDSLFQGLIGGASPALSVGVGSPALFGSIVSRFVTNTGVSNNTDTSLEDAIINVTGTLGYV